MKNKAALLLDRNGFPIPVVGLKDSQDVDGTLISAKSDAIIGNLVRIVAKTGDAGITVTTGADPTALATSIFIPPFGELWLPIIIGYKVAVLGGKANITTANVVFE
jgi:hypothetical protein